MAKRPADARYLPTHEWGRLEKDGTVTVGITDFAVDQLNDLTFVDFRKEKGDKIEKGESFGEIESVKAVSDMYCPVSGTVLAVNSDVSANDFEALKKDASGKAWLLKIKPSNPKELDSAKSLADYEKQLASEAH